MDNSFNLPHTLVTTGVKGRVWWVGLCHTASHLSPVNEGQSQGWGRRGTTRPREKERVSAEYCFAPLPSDPHSLGLQSILALAEATQFHISPFIYGFSLFQLALRRQSYSTGQHLKPSNWGAKPLSSLQTLAASKMPSAINYHHPSSPSFAWKQLTYFFPSYPCKNTRAHQHTHTHVLPGWNHKCPGSSLERMFTTGLDIPQNRGLEWKHWQLINSGGIRPGQNVHVCLHFVCVSRISRP